LPVWLPVGELDTSWVESTIGTTRALAESGIDVRVDPVPGEGHVLFLNPVDPMTWIDEAIGHSP
jgi:hypothetical protein